MPHRLPPLNALRAFEAAARHMSFAKAAEELFVTPAALSYQIKQLEDHLGAEVFRRLNRAVELTDAGLALQPGVTAGFDSLRQAVHDMERALDDNVLTITAGPAFTAKWLAPRFFRFADQHPEFELRFVASLRLMDFRRDGIDAAIRFGTSDDEGYYSEILSDEWLTPVCTPSIAERIKTDGGLQNLTLLHDESIEFLTPPPNWAAWARATNIELDLNHGPRFTNADHSIDVALEGGGIALGRSVLVERYLSSGRLVAPVKTALRSGGHFRFVCPNGSETSKTIATLLDWIREEMAAIDDHRQEMTFVDP